MPAVFLDRLPLPSLQAYTVGSVLLLACSVHYAVQMTSQHVGLLNGTTVSHFAGASDVFVYEKNVTYGLYQDQDSLFDVFVERVCVRRVIEVLYFMLQEPMCIWVSLLFVFSCNQISLIL